MEYKDAKKRMDNFFKGLSDEEFENILIRAGINEIKPFFQNPFLDKYEYVYLVYFITNENPQGYVDSVWKDQKKANEYVESFDDPDIKNSYIAKFVVN